MRSATEGVAVAGLCVAGGGRSGAGSMCPRSASSLATLTTPITSSRLPRHTGYHEWPVAPALAIASATLSDASSHSMFERGSINEVSKRSSSKNTFCTIWCSCASITPASTPSSRLAAISSSVTARSPLLSTRSSLRTAWVLNDSRRTKGLAPLATHIMGRDTRRATVSG